MEMEFKEYDLRNEFDLKTQKTLLKRIDVLHKLMLNAENLLPEQVDFICKHFRVFIGIVPSIIDILDHPEFIFERLTINKDVLNGKNERVKNIEQLIYPPHRLGKKIGYNRANLIGSPMFYCGASGTLPVTVETKPKFGQLITETKWKLKKGTSLKMFVVAQDAEVAMKNPDHLLNNYNNYQRYLATLPPKTRIVIESVFEFVVSAFTRKVDRSNKQGYLLSALFSDFLINHPITPVDAIFYPSVANNGSFINIAITPNGFNNCLEFVSAKEKIVTTEPTRDNPIWFGTVTGDAKDIHLATGLVQWQDSLRGQDEYLERIIKDYNISF